MQSARTRIALFTALSLLAALACSGGGQPSRIENQAVRLEVTSTAGLAISLKDGQDLAPLSTGEEPAFYLLGTDSSAVALQTASISVEKLSGNANGSINLTLVPPVDSPFKGVKVEVSLSLDQTNPGAILSQTTLSGLTPEVLAHLAGTRFYVLDARAERSDPELPPYGFVLFQGAAYGEGSWYTRIHPQPGYDAPNWTVRHEPRQHDGGGIPLNYAWTRKAGLAIALADTTARVAALPVRVTADSTLQLAVEQPVEFIHPDESGAAQGLPVMLGAFHGDYFAPLRAWATLLEARGFRFAQAPEGSYEGIWCSWGFGREVTRDDILRNIPVAKKLGLPWVVMDDGYQTGLGSWDLDRKKFPRGDSDMRALVDSIHAAGLKAKLWWVPMNVSATDPLYAAHPDWVVLGKDGQPVENKWWNCYQLCPAYAPVVEQQVALARHFIADWGYDGFKMDGSCQAMAGPCYNPAHHHARPEQSCEATAALFKAICDQAQALKPGSVLEVCECGVPPSPFKMAFCNQQVSADPVSSEQVRARIKMYRAILGDKGAPYGDHVELSSGWYVKRAEVVEDGNDFASSLATGGVIGTKFTALAEDTTGLDWHKHVGNRAHWEKWIGLYNKLKLYQGECLNLYDTAWDKPEAYAVGKDGEVFYGFFAPEFKGALELRGLKEGVKYALTNYAEDDSPLGEVTGGPGAALETQFTEHLLLRAKPVQ